MSVYPEKKSEQAKSYVLLTAARNEEAYIERTIASVLAQTVLPEKWVIVDDGSTDRTGEIVRRYAEREGFIVLLQRRDSGRRDFASKVNALKAGYDLLGSLRNDFIGNLDADITFEPTYYEALMERFRENPRLGIAGGFIYEERGGRFKSRRVNRPQSVGHAAQLVRRECFAAIGGYVALPYGGEDWYAEISARMKGWTVQAFPEINVYHHKSGGSVNRLIRARFRQGLMDYSVGSLPLFELLKCFLRLPERPLVVGAFALLSGFVWSNFRGDKILVSEEFVQFLRREQKERLWSWLPRSLKRKAGSAGKVAAQNRGPT